MEINGNQIPTCELEEHEYLFGVADGIIRDQSARIAELEVALRDIVEKEEEYRSRPSTKTGGAATRSIRKAGEVLRGH